MLSAYDWGTYLVALFDAFEITNILKNRQKKGLILVCTSWNADFLFLRMHEILICLTLLEILFQIT